MKYDAFNEELDGELKMILLILAVVALLIFLLPLLGLSFGLTIGIFNLVSSAWLKWLIIVVALLYVLNKLKLLGKMKGLVRLG